MSVEIGYFNFYKISHSIGKSSFTISKLKEIILQEHKLYNKDSIAKNKYLQIKWLHELGSNLFYIFSQKFLMKLSSNNLPLIIRCNILEYLNPIEQGKLPIIQYGPTLKGLLEAKKNKQKRKNSILRKDANLIVKNLEQQNISNIDINKYPSKVRRLLAWKEKQKRYKLLQISIRLYLIPKSQIYLFKLKNN